MHANYHEFVQSAQGTVRKLIRVGSQHAPDYSLQRKVIQANIGAWVTLINILFFNLIFAWIGNLGLIISGLVQIPIGCLIVAIVLWLHHLGKIELARWLLFCGVMFDVAAAIIAAQGTVIFIHGYYLIFAVLTTIFIPIQRWPSMLVLALADVALFAFFQIHGWPARPETLTLSQSGIVVLETLMIASCAIVVVVLMIISEYSAARNEYELQLMANSDPLTNLPNRRAFRARLKRNLEQMERDGGAIAVAMIDIDFFKRINDDHGHDTGDLILQLLSQLLLHHVRAEDTLARMGGEEFALLLPQTSQQQAYAVTERMRAAAEHSLFGNTQSPLRITISIGLTSIESGTRVDQAIKAADEALYSAKHQGRNRVVIYSATA